MALTQLTKVDGGGISTTSDYRVGIITASKFVGPFDGTGGNFSGVVTATNGVFSGNISAVDGNFSGNVTIGGTLTYEDVTNIDSVGIITAQKDVHVGAGLSVVGVTTLTGNILAGGTSIPGISGADDLTIGNETGHHGITIRSGATNNGALFFSDDTVGGSNSNQWAAGIEYNHPTSDLRFYVGNTWRFSFSGIGHYTPYSDSTINIGTVSKRFLNVFSNNLNLSANATISGDLDVDGHTNLDNVSIAGITTFSGIVDAVNTPASIRVAQDIQHKGDADTKISFPADNTISFDTAGSTRFGFSSSGNIELHGTQTGNNVATIFNGTGFLGFYASSNSGVNRDFRFFSSNSNSNESLRISSNGNVNVYKDLDVDGHTNLDNLSVAGVSTFSNNIHVGTGITFETNGQATFSGITTFSEGVIIPDNKALSLGNRLVGSTAGDLRLYHDTNNSYIDEIGAGNLYIRNNTNNSIFCQTSGKVELYYNGNDKLATTNTGVSVSGTLVAGALDISGDIDVDGHTELDNVNIAGIATFNHGGSEVVRINSGGLLLYNDLSFFGASTHAYWDHSSNQFILNDNTKLSAGNGSDLQIYHLQSDNNSYIVESGSGSLMIQGDIINIGNVGSSKYYIRCFEDGAVQLRYGNNLTKLATTATGIEVTGEVAASQDYPDIRPTLDFNFAATKKLDSRISYHRSGPASYHDEFGKVVLVSADAPRFDHTFPEYWDEGNLGESNSRGISKGLLIERSRTNIYKNNHNLTTANDHGSITQTVNTTETTAPDGTLTATKIAVSGSDQWTRWDSNNGLDISQVNFTDIFSTSIYMKTVGTSNVNVAMDFGDNGGKTFSVGQEWKRYAISNVHHNYGGSTKFIDIVFNGSVYIWGLQCENGENPSSYIPTRGSSETRGDEYVVIDGQDFTDFYNPVESSLLAVGTMHQTLNAQGQLNIAHIGNSNNDGHGIFREHGTRDVWYHIRNNNTTPSGGNINPNGFGDWDENEEARIAIAFKNGDQAISVNGGNQVTATVTSNYPTANITKMWIGSAGNGSFFNGTISRIAYYPKQLTDSQLNTLTA